MKCGKCRRWSCRGRQELDHGAGQAYWATTRNWNFILKTTWSQGKRKDKISCSEENGLLKFKCGNIRLLQYRLNLWGWSRGGDRFWGRVYGTCWWMNEENKCQLLHSAPIACKCPHSNSQAGTIRFRLYYRFCLFCFVCLFYNLWFIKMKESIVDKLI